MKGKKSKKKIALYIVLGILAAIVIAVGIDICVTEINASKIPHRYASKEEGVQLMLSNNEYFDNCNQNDVEFRVKKIGATIDDYRTASAESVKEFGIFEKYYLDRQFSKMYKRLKSNDYTLPEIDEMVLIKMDMGIESGASGFTHGTEIYLNSIVVVSDMLMSLMPGGSNIDMSMEKLLWHEMFHCLTRCNPDFRTDMYSLINFTVVGEDYELPPCIKDKALSNPDVEHRNSYATFEINGQEIDCFVVWMSTEDYADVQTDWSDYEAVALVPIDGSDVYYMADEASNFDEVFGTNTYYTIDPEECLADNFAYAMKSGIEGYGGRGYNNPEIIQGIIDWMSK